MTPIQHIKDDTLILADQAEKALEQIRESVKEFITDKCHPKSRRTIQDAV
jgi:Serine dehydrogenase proteinase